VVWHTGTVEIAVMDDLEATEPQRIKERVAAVVGTGLEWGWTGVAR